MMTSPASASSAAVRCNDSQPHFGVYPHARLAFNRAVADWCLRNAGSCLDRQALEQALQWDDIAAQVMSFECATLVSPALEQQLLQIGRGLADPETTTHSRKQSERWLHVLTEVYPDGGHSAMLRRWIQQDPRPNRHSIVLLAQTVSVPAALLEVLQGKGGSVIRLDARDTLLGRAVRLRKIVREQADVVVLHIHPWDVIATVALAISAGPPVLLVNHAAHIFWVGASVADMILNCRYSLQEDEWTTRYRGCHRIMHVPIPLNEPVSSVVRSAAGDDGRENARNLLKLPQDAIVMLTVGIGHKYTPLEGLDFLHAIRAVLQARGQAYLVAVGLKYDARWVKLQEEVGGRLILVEKQPATAMATFFETADIYLEGFPFGSTTSLLEAGLHGIACVLSPQECPPPFTSDGIALQLLHQSSDMSDYVTYILLLLDDPKERLRIGQLLANSVRAHHCGSGWGAYLEKVQDNLPAVHQVHAVDSSEQVPEGLSAYWTAFSHAVNDDPLDVAFRAATIRGLKPKIDQDLARELRRSGKRGRGRQSSSLSGLAVYSIRHSLRAFLKRVYLQVTSLHPRIATMTERMRIVCQTGK